MFLPTRIEHHYERTPYVTYALLGLNVVAFLLTFSEIDERFHHLKYNTEAFEIWQPITSMFLHIGFFHLIGNMIFLAVYGQYVEERLGPWRYLAAYLVFGVLAGVTWAATDEGRALGASGAISGLMGFVLVAAPFARVRVIWVFWIYVYFIYRRFKIEALWLIGAWLAFQLFDAWLADAWDRVAYAAHLGGFAAGCGLAAFLKSDHVKGTDWWLDDALPDGGPAATKRLNRARKFGRLAKPEPAAPTRFVVSLRGLRADASPVAVLKLIMKHTGATPEAAKETVDAVRGGEPQPIEFETPEAAATFIDAADALGADAERDEPASDALPQGAVR